MALIEFLIKNWFIVIILLALFSQFKKVYSRGDTSGEGKGSMPTFGGNPRVPQQMSKMPNLPETLQRTGQGVFTVGEDRKSSGSGFDSPQKASSGSPPDNRRTLLDSGSASSSSKEGPFLEGKERTESPFFGEYDSNAQAESYVYANAFADTAATAAAVQTSKKQLAQGIIWAEILGPPRAKKPFRR